MRSRLAVKSGSLILQSYTILIIVSAASLSIFQAIILEHLLSQETLSFLIASTATRSHIIPPGENLWPPVVDFPASRPELKQPVGRVKSHRLRYLSATFLER